MSTASHWPNGYGSAGYGLPSTVFLCTRCGAIVMASATNLHDAFHADATPGPVPGFTPPICSWCSRPIHGDAEGELNTGRVHHARDECPSPPGWPERG